MRHSFIFASLALLAAVSCSTGKPMNTPKELLAHRLFAAVENNHILYGHQDDLVYGHDWLVTDTGGDTLGRSDVRAVSGHFPAIVGFDLGGIEFGDSANLDGVDFGLMRRAALKHIERGGIVTFSWHPRNPLTGGDAWDVSSDQVVSSVLEGGQLHPLFMQWLDRTADFLESLGKDTPIIFRPWHENVGSWFWWGGGLCSENDYRELYRLTWVHFTKARGLENILWCYSPNGNATVQEYMARYPGDEFVNILGVDTYMYVGDGSVEVARVRYMEELRGILVPLNAIATEHHKLMCLSETGLEGLTDPSWWTETLYPMLREFPVAYVLTWRNAHDKPGHFYAPWPGFSGENDFIEFCNKEEIELL